MSLHIKKMKLHVICTRQLQDGKGLLLHTDGKFGLCFILLSYGVKCDVLKQKGLI